MSVTLAERRERCQDALQRAYVEVGDTDRVLWSAADVTRSVEPKDRLDNLNDALAAYVDALRRATNRTYDESERWAEDIAGGHEFPGGETLAVTLDKVDEWRSIQYLNDETDRVHEAHLSVSYVRELLRQATAIAREEELLKESKAVEEGWRSNF